MRTQPSKPRAAPRLKGTGRGAMAYLCLETSIEGHACHVHSTEVVNGLRGLGIDIDYFAFSPKGGHRSSLLWRAAASFVIQLKLLLRRRRYDAIYVRGHPLAFPTSLICYLSGIPLIQEVNGTYQDIYLTYPSLRLVSRVIDSIWRYQYRHCAGLIAVTPQLADWLRDELGYPRPPITIITNAANIELFHPGKRCNLHLPKPYVVFVGSQVAWHDTDVLLRALKEACWPGDVTLLLVGECGNALDVQRALQESPNLAAIGFIPHEDVGGVLAGAMAAIVAIGNPDERCSSAGVAPIKLFEAFACGIPVVASELPFQSELVRELDAGLLYAPGDAAGLAKAVAAIRCTGLLRKDQSTLDIVHTRHSWTARAEQTRDFINKVMEEERSRSQFAMSR